MATRNRNTYGRGGYAAGRPAGASDNSDMDSEEGDFFDISSFRHNKTAATKSNYNPNSSNYTNQNGLVHDDWEADEGTNEQSSVPQEETWGETTSETIRLACLRGNLAKLKEQLASESVPKFNINDFFHRIEETPLITACDHAHPEIVEYLVEEKSANPNVKHHNSKKTALMAVASCDYSKEDQVLERCATALVKAGANVDIQDRYGMSSLMIAVKRKRNKLVRYLLESQADPNLTEPDGRTALFFATMDGDGRMCRLLVEYGADVNIQDRFGTCVPELAQDRNFPELANLLFTVRDTKWKPGLHPQLMMELDEEAAAERKAKANDLSIKEDSTIEMILASADGTKYLNNFRKHKISYVHLLTLDNEQLKEIGVDEVGVRERLLDTIKQIHNAQWGSDSIRNIANNKNVTAAEAVCMVVNIKEQLDRISASLSYVNKRIKQNPLALQYDIERNRLEDLLKFCEESERSSVKVRQIMVELHNTIGNLQGYTELQIAGRIPKRSFNDLRKKSSSFFQWKLGCTIVVGIGAACTFLALKIRK